MMYIRDQGADTKELIEVFAKSKTIKDWSDLKPGTRIRAISRDAGWSKGTTATFESYDQDSGKVLVRDIVSAASGRTYSPDLDRYSSNHWELV